MTSDIGSKKLLSYKDVQALTGLSRAAIKRAVKRGDLPAPLHLGNGKSAPARWRESEIQAWLTKPATVSEANLRALAHAPRRGEREKRQRAASLPQYGDIPSFRAGGFEDREQARLAARLKPVDDRTRPIARGRGNGRRRFAGLMDALAAGWNGGRMPMD